MEPMESVPVRRFWMKRDFWVDTAERVVSTFLFAALGALVASGGSFDWKGAVGAGVAAALSTLKAIVGAQRSDNTSSPASLF